MPITTFVMHFKQKWLFQPTCSTVIVHIGFLPSLNGNDGDYQKEAIKRTLLCNFYGSLSRNKRHLTLWHSRPIASVYKDIDLSYCALQTANRSGTLHMVHCTQLLFGVTLQIRSQYLFVNENWSYLMFPFENFLDWLPSVSHFF